MVNAQEWLDQNYPKQNRSKVWQIYLNEPNLEGELDLGDFIYSFLKIYISPQVDETKLTFINKSEKIEVIPVVAERYLNYHYPKKRRKQTEELNIRDKELENKLVLNDFTSLEKLNCSYNKLTILNVSSCLNLKELSCSHNQLTQLFLPKKLDNLEMLNCSKNLLTDLDFNALSENLTYLDLSNNNLSTRDLSCFSRLTELEVLDVGTYDQNKINQNLYNHWIGSLEPLKYLSKLKELHIQNTDLNDQRILTFDKDYERLEYLPSSLKKIKYSTKERPDCKLTSLVPLLEEFNEYGQCSSCKEPNTSKNWCQSCFEKELKKDLGHLTGQELVEKFVEQQNKNYERLKWIPYEKFTNIEYLASGGFSKIYKAKWKRNCVVLKSLINSKNITLEFLSEITNTKLVDGSIDIVKCYGISQEPNTKNYVMVMKYIEKGSLREYLKNNYNKLSWGDKFYKLRNIAYGLDNIHQQNLVHRDFHSGNILNSSDLRSYITDLGLSKPVSQQKEENKIFGVLPYVAPEVLQEQTYTKASDIYSFGIIAYELLSGLPPYCDREHDTDLALQICNGLRPQFQIKIPALLEDLINKCWDGNPNDRPSAKELFDVIYSWHDEIKGKKNTEFTQQLQEAEEYNQTLPEETRFPKHKIHSGAVYHSKAINTRQITQLLKTRQFVTKDLDLNLGMIEEQLENIEISEDSQEESSYQTKIEILPK